MKKCLLDLLNKEKEEVDKFNRVLNSVNYWKTELESSKEMLKKSIIFEELEVEKKKLKEAEGLVEKAKQEIKEYFM